MKRRLILLSGVMALAFGLFCLGCASTTNSATQSESATAPTSETASVELRTPTEWAADYPLEGDSFFESRMSKTYEAFKGASIAAFGGEDAPSGCAACHAQQAFDTKFPELGDTLLTAWASDENGIDGKYWSNCTNCHVGDPGDGVVEGANAYGAATGASAAEYIDEDDLLCGQCHALFPGESYMEEANSPIDQYKYGVDADSMLKAYKEFFEEHPVTSTSICAGMVGVPSYDEAIQAEVYMTDNCNVVELFQGSNHQTMGLTCTDCHMTTSTSSDGTEYTNHNMTRSPLENPDALKKCLTCHKAQGIENEDAMVSFVKGKFDEMNQRQAAVKANLDATHEVLAQAVASGTADEDTLAKAKDDYVTAYAYWLYATPSMDVNENGETEYTTGIHNYAYAMQLFDKADELLNAATGSLS